MTAPQPDLPLSASYAEALLPYLAADIELLHTATGIPAVAIANPSSALVANQKFFNRRDWAQTYFEACHRYPGFRDRWLAATGGWDDKIVVDIGCGPGNLAAALQQAPKVLIGVDVSEGALQMAAGLGYVPLLANAEALPLRSGFADVVAINASLHHCDDMTKVLTEAARIVRPGGILAIDHDPQQTAWDFRGLAMMAYRMRLSVYRWLLPSLHVDMEERLAALATETHHQPGDGVTAELFQDTLTPLGFSIELVPHNNTVGAEALQGNMGEPSHWRYRLGQRLSGIDPNSPEAALSLMCIAQYDS